MEAPFDLPVHIPVCQKIAGKIGKMIANSIMKANVTFSMLFNPINAKSRIATRVVGAARS
jgi:hypothetical protein